MLKKQVYYVPELDCQSEVRVLENSFSKLKGVLDIQFDILQSRVIIEYESSKVSKKHLEKAIRSCGYKPKSERAGENLQAKLKGKILLTVFSGFFLILAYLIERVFFTTLLKWFLQDKATSIIPFLFPFFLTLSLVLSLWHIIPKAFYSVKSLHADMNLLVVIGAIGALLIGYPYEAASVAFLFSLSLILEQGSIKKARKSIQKLLDIKTSEVLKRCDEAFKKVDVKTLQVGDIIQIKAGQKVPIDAKILEGESSLDESSITGEPLAKRKQRGDLIFAGTINLQSVIECRVEKKFHDTMLAKMVRIVERAQEKKANLERWIEKFAAVYTPLMILFAALVAIIPPLLFGGFVLTWLYRALVILMVACPCALVISTPVTILSALTSAAKSGVLVKGGTFLEIPSTLKAIAFDKTGTLTCGQISIDKEVFFKKESKELYRQIAIGIEKQSSHPLAQAFSNLTTKTSHDDIRLEQVQEHPGLGMEAKYQEKSFYLGSVTYLKTKMNFSKEAEEVFEQLIGAGLSVIAFGCDDQLIAFFGLSDVVRDEAKQTIEELKRQGLKLVMLTGDQEIVAKNVASQVKIEDFYANLTPTDKLEIIYQLQEHEGPCAMIGDGINDSASMAEANLGVSMGKFSSDVAIESADIVLVKDDIQKLPWIIKHSKKTLSVLKQNVAISLVIKAVFLGLACFGYATLWMAIAADTGASLVVIANGLKMLKKDKRK